MIKLRIIVALPLYNDRQHKNVINVVPITKCLLRYSRLGNVKFFSNIHTHKNIKG